MYRLRFLLLNTARLLVISTFGALLVVLRYILKTPQPLESVLPGEPHLFKWTHGHVFYTTCGLRDGPPLVILHTPEIGGSSYEFRAVVEQLAQHYHIYALDLLGFGLFDRPNIYYTGETYTTLCQDFLTHIVQQPAVLVASGLSCNYGIAVTSTQPQLCERLVLLSPTAQPIEDIARPSSAKDMLIIQEEVTQNICMRGSETYNVGLAAPAYTKEYKNISKKESTMADEKVEAYCVKCKEKRIMKDPTDTVTKNGRSAKTGTCPVCGTKLFRFVAN